MSKPLVVVIPHQLGRAGARARIEGGVAQLKSKFGSHLTSIEEAWTDDRLDVSIRALGQGITAAIEILDREVRVEVELPWMLAMVAEKAKGFIRREGTLLLEKK